MTLLPGWGRAFALGLLVGGASLLAGGGIQAALYESRAMRAAQLSAAVCGALLLLALRRPLDAATRAVGGARGPVAAWLALSVGALSLAFALLNDLVHALEATWRFQYGDPRLWECEPEALGVAGVVGLAASGFARARLPDRGALRTATLACGAAALLLALGVARRDATHPAIQQVPVAPTLATLPAMGLPGVPGNPTRPARFVDQTLAGIGLTARRYDFGDGRACALRLARGDGATRLPTVVDPRDETLIGCGTLAVQLDRSMGALVVTAPSVWSSTRAVFDAQDGSPWAPSRVAYLTWRRRGAAPLAWLVAALAALLVAAVWASRPVEARWWAARASWREGELGGDGVITLTGDGSRVVAPFGAALAPGPVVLRSLAAGEDSPFRGTARVDAVTRDDVRAGTAASVAVQLTSEEDARAACALFAALLAVATLAPLWLVHLAP
ncbi:MAG: hypothetical protein U0325_25720 [Polyangiales bacterium]